MMIRDLRVRLRKRPFQKVSFTPPPPLLGDLNLHSNHPKSRNSLSYKFLSIRPGQDKRYSKMDSFPVSQSFAYISNN